MNESSLREKKPYSTLVFLFTNCPKVLKILYDMPVRYYV